MAKFSPYSLALWVAFASAGNANASDDEDRFNADDSIEFGNGCGYELTFSFDHDEDLPIPSGPADCNPENPAIAPDRLPYLASRSKEYKFSDEIYKKTGFASMGLNFNPCGHPPINFGGPHYDAHFYTKPKEVREKWTCDLLPGAPICNFLDLSQHPPVLDIAAAQTTNSGRAFFNLATVLGTNGTLANMPPNFRCDADHAVPGMGEHCWDFNIMPNSFSEWDEPSTIMGTYDSDIAFFETMFSLDFVTGNQKNTYSESPAYEGQTISTLPSEYEVNYGGQSTGRTTIILRGNRAFCEEI